MRTIPASALCTFHRIFTICQFKLFCRTFNYVITRVRSAFFFWIIIIEGTATSLPNIWARSIGPSIFIVTSEQMTFTGNRIFRSLHVYCCSHGQAYWSTPSYTGAKHATIARHLTKRYRRFQCVSLTIHFFLAQYLILTKWLVSCKQHLTIRTSEQHSSIDTAALVGTSAYICVCQLFRTPPPTMQGQGSVPIICRSQNTECAAQ